MYIHSKYIIDIDIELLFLFNAFFQAVVSVSDQWRHLRCMTQRHVLGLLYPWCRVNVRTVVWYGTQLGGCVYSEGCGREEDTRAPNSPRMSTFLTPAKVSNHIYFLMLFISSTFLCIINLKGFKWSYCTDRSLNPATPPMLRTHTHAHTNHMLWFKGLCKPSELHFEF